MLFLQTLEFVKLNKEQFKQGLKILETPYLSIYQGHMTFLKLYILLSTYLFCPCFASYYFYFLWFIHHANLVGTRGVILKGLCSLSACISFAHS